METYFVPTMIIENLPKEQINYVEEIYFDNKPCYYSVANETKNEMAPGNE